MNKTILMGRLTADPELKQTPNGVSVCAFSIAVDREYTPSGQEKQADFINCVAWREKADFISKYFSKGKMIALDGNLQSRNYNSKDGQKRTAFEVIVNSVYFTGDKSQSPAEVSQHAQGHHETVQTNLNDNQPNKLDFEEIDVTDEDLPF